MNKELMACLVIALVALAGAGAVMLSDSGINAEAAQPGVAGAPASLCTIGHPGCEPDPSDPPPKP